MPHGKTLILRAINPDPVVNVLSYGTSTSTLVRDPRGPIRSADGVTRYREVYGPVRKKRKRPPQKKTDPDAWKWVDVKHPGKG
jgi:hypothetical protein